MLAHKAARSLLIYTSAPTSDFHVRTGPTLFGQNLAMSTAVTLTGPESPQHP